MKRIYINLIKNISVSSNNHFNKMEWNISIISGGIYYKNYPLFNNKYNNKNNNFYINRSLIISKGTTIASLSLSTHETNYLLVNYLYFTQIDHKKEINDFLVDLENNNLLYSCSLDKTIKHWNIKEQKCLQTIELNKAIYSICYDYNDSNYLYVLIGENKNWSIVHYNLKKRESEQVIKSFDGNKPDISTKKYIDVSNHNATKRGYEEIITVLTITHENILYVYNSATKSMNEYKHV